jgi:glycine cleavage system aminomethyltransferase T/glycine/D-amino acid oxidase-like deaminating enzyme
VSAGPRVVIIGAGIVGCALADELTARGWTNVTVLDQGPPFRPGGSTGHAPGLVFQTSPSKTMTDFARYTVAKYAGLAVDGEPCLHQVGGLELATTPERWADLQRRHGWAVSWGVPAFLRSAEECARLHPLIDPDRILGGFHIPGDGLARPVLAAAAQANRAAARGASFRPGQRVTGISQAGGRVTGVITGTGDVPADVVVCCAGIWGPVIGALVDLAIPLVPMAHQYARTTPLPALSGRGDDPDTATAPILRHQGADLYFREHGPRMGVGAYGHRPMPVDPAEIGRPAAVAGTPHGGGTPGIAAPSPAEQPFTPMDFEESWAAAIDLLPALGEAKVAEGINGLFSFTPDGNPLLGEHPGLRGFWTAEAVWITHSAGVAKALAEWLVQGQPSVAVQSCDLNRFEEAQLAPGYVHARSCQSFAEVYDIVHPQQPPGRPRPVRTSPFYARQQELGAVFTEAAGWERPLWFEANAGLPEARQVPRRNDWASRYWSPVAGAEALVTRQRVAMYDMTPLKRLDVSGPGALAFLQGLTTGQLDKRPGTVTYTLLLGDDGGIRSDLTVARLGPDQFQVGVNGPLDLDWMRRRLPADGPAAGTVQIRDITAGTCCIGLWGPLARDVLQPLTTQDFSAAAMKYFRTQRAYIGDVPVTALRLSYVGELGWELYTGADTGQLLWDTLWEAGRPHGIIAAGRGAFNSLRLEKGYRAWGTDMTAEHDPYEAGLGFAVRMDKGDFVGREALAQRSGRDPGRRLTCLVIGDPAQVVLGSEPVFASGTPAGYVTSAAYGYTIGASIAYAWLPAAVAAPGTAVEIGYFGERVPAVVAAEPLFDPAMTRLRA